MGWQVEIVPWYGPELGHGTVMRRFGSAGQWSVLPDEPEVPPEGLELYLGCVIHCGNGWIHIERAEDGGTDGSDDEVLHAPERD